MIDSVDTLHAHALYNSPGLLTPYMRMHFPIPHRYQYRDLELYNLHEYRWSDCERNIISNI